MLTVLAIVLLTILGTCGPLSLARNGTAPGPAVPSARPQEGASPWQRGDRAAYALTLLALLGSAITGLIGWLGAGQLGGWLLVGHMVAAPAFILGLAVLTFRLAERCRLGLGDPQPSAISACADRPPTIAFSLGTRLAFWAALALGLAVIASMLLAMIPVFGYGGQEVLTQVHRYCGLGLILVAGAQVAGALVGTRRR